MPNNKKIFFFNTVGDYEDGIIVQKKIQDILKTTKLFSFNSIYCGGLVNNCFIQKYKNKKNTLNDINSNSSRCISCKNSIIKNKETIYLNDVEIKTKPDLKKDIKKIDEIVDSTLCRYYAKSKPSEEYLVKEMKTKFKEASLKYYYAAYNLLSKEKKHIHCVFMHHGIYIPQGIFALVCDRLNVSYYSWWKSYRDGTVLFSQNKSYHSEFPYLNDVDIKTKLTEKKKAILSSYFYEKRQKDTADWIKFRKKTSIIEGLKLNVWKFLNKRRLKIGIFTNVAWDANAHYKGISFPNQETWLLKTIRFLQKENVAIILKTHPAEKYGLVRSRDNISNYLHKNKIFNKFYNFWLIKPESKLSTYDILDEIDICLTYSSKVSMEASYLKKLVLCAGEAWGKETTAINSTTSEKKYFKALKTLLLNFNNNSNLNNSKGEELIYYVFFKRMVKIFGKNNNELSKSKKLFISAVVNKKQIICDVHS